MYATINTPDTPDTPAPAEPLAAAVKLSAKNPPEALARFKVSCKALCTYACALEAASIKLSALLPAALLEAGLSGLCGKPTGIALATLCLVTGGMSPVQAGLWVAEHKKIVAACYTQIRGELLAAGVPGMKAAPLPSTDKRPKSASQAKPVTAKPAAAPNGSPLASDLAYALSAASSAALEAAWETLPLSTRTKVLEAFSA